MGEIYEGEVVGIKDFGAFVRLTPGKDGLLHISRMANGRVGKVEDVLSIGDTVKVEVIEVGDNGKISLDRIDKPEVASAPRRSNDGGRHNHDGNSRKPRRRHTDR